MTISLSEVCQTMNYRYLKINRQAVLLEIRLQIV